MRVRALLGFYHRRYRYVRFLVQTSTIASALMEICECNAGCSAGWDQRNQVVSRQEPLPLPCYCVFTLNTIHPTEEFRLLIKTFPSFLGEGGWMNGAITFAATLEVSCISITF